MKAKQDIEQYNFEKFRNAFMTTDGFDSGDTRAFKIFKIQEVIQYLKFPLPLHRTEYFDILFVVSGDSCTKHCGLKKYEIVPPSIFFKGGGQITSSEIYSENIQGFFCLIEKDFLTSYNIISPATFNFFKFGANPILTLPNDDVTKFEFLFDKLYALYNSRVENKTKLIASYLIVTLEEALTLYNLQNNVTEENHHSTAEMITSRFKDLVAEHFLTKQDVSEYAAMLFITPNHLNKTIKAVTSKTALELIHEMILLEAKVLLNQTDKNISEIAFHLSFDDSSYFSRFFKKLTGVTPLEFRKME